MARARNNGGYALALTLVVVAIVSMSLLTAARHSLARAAAAIESHRELQRRWGALSLERAILPVAESTLDRAQVTTHEPVAAIWREIKLGDLTFRWVLCDEQAKPNAARLLRGLGAPDAEKVLQRLLAQSSVARIKVRVPQAASQHAATEIVGYGQLLDATEPLALVGRDAHDGAVAARLTCWGDGRLNVRRVSARALRDVLSPPLDEISIQRLIAARQSVPRLSLHQVLDRMDLVGDQRASVAQMLCDGSTCHALWTIACIAGNQGRVRLAVSEKGATRVMEW